MSQSAFLVSLNKSIHNSAGICRLFRPHMHVSGKYGKRGIRERENSCGH